MMICVPKWHVRPLLRELLKQPQYLFEKDGAARTRDWMPGGCAAVWFTCSPWRAPQFPRRILLRFRDVPDPPVLLKLEFIEPRAAQIAVLGGDEAEEAAAPV